jgi:hypothetical protein
MFFREWSMSSKLKKNKLASTGLELVAPKIHGILYITNRVQHNALKK